MDDLPDFIVSVASQGHQWDHADAITQNESYLCTTFFLFTELYHKVRGSAAWVANPYLPGVKFLQFPQNKISEEHERLFYQEGSIHAQWRALYNDFCDRVRLHVPEADLAAVSKGDLRWIQKDEGPETFYRL